MKLLGQLIVNILALLIVEYIVPGFNIAGIWVALVTAVILGVVNTYIRPILQIVALPISILTFGIAAFLINVLLLWTVHLIVPGFDIDSFTTAMIASILLSLVSWFLASLAKKDGTEI